MADKKISQLDAIVSQSTTDLYETSLNGSGSRKETRAQQTSYQQSNLDFIHTTGSVSLGDVVIYGPDGKNAKSSGTNISVDKDYTGLKSVAVTQDPTTALQLTTKQYVDGLISERLALNGCSAASVPGQSLNATYNNGSSGVGATLTNSGTQVSFSLDNAGGVVGYRYLIWQQTNPAHNGIYVLTTLGSGASNWVLTRATDFNTTAKIISGAYTCVVGGSKNQGKCFGVDPGTPIVVGTTDINFSEPFASLSMLRGLGYLSGSWYDILNTETKTFEIFPTNNIKLENSSSFDTSIGLIGKFVLTTGTGSPYIEVLLRLNASEAWPVGSILGFEQRSASQVRVTPEMGVTLDVLGGGDAAISQGYGSVFFLKKWDTDYWVAYGDLSPSTDSFKYWTTDGDLQPNSDNVAGSVSLVTLTLPDTSTTPSPYANVIKIVNGNSGGWKIQCPLDTLIFVGNQACALGGYIASTGIGDSLIMRLVAPSIWEAYGIQGTISIDGTSTNNAINSTHDSAYVNQTGTSATLGVNTINAANNASLFTGTLPAVAAVGDIIEVVYKGAGGWRIAQPSSVSVRLGNQVTTTGVGGYLEFTDVGDCVKLLCTTANTGWEVTSFVGNITVA